MSENDTIKFNKRKKQKYYNQMWRFFEKSYSAKFAFHCQGIHNRQALVSSIYKH